jgi:hypothetical protein
MHRWFMACLLLAFPAACVLAQPRNLPRPRDVDQAFVSADDARAALETFRRAGPASAYYAEFRLRFLPRRGMERVTPGRMWVGADASGGPVMLLNIGGEVPVHLLLRSGAAPELWALEPGEGQAARMLSGQDMFEPVARTQFTPYTLLMPFIYWDSAEFEGARQVRGRLTYAFVFRPPMPFPAERAGFHAVRGFLDTQFSALSEVAYLDEALQPVMVLRVLELKRVQGEWVVRMVDLRDERSGDKTRLETVAVAVRVQMPSWQLDPAALATPLPQPPPDQLVRLTR